MGGQYIAFFLLFMGLIAIMGFMGQDFATVADLDALPTIEEDGGFLDTLSYIWDFVIYLFSFRGFLIFGIPSFIANIITSVLYGVLIYVILRLIRGGG
jgi:hypothetical protein